MSDSVNVDDFENALMGLIEDSEIECPACGEVITIKDAASGRCPKCGATFES